MDCSYRVSEFLVPGSAANKLFLGFEVLLLSRGVLEMLHYLVHDGLYYKHSCFSHEQRDQLAHAKLKLNKLLYK